MVAEVGRYVHFIFLLISFILSGVLFLFFETEFFWSFRFLLENLKVMFPFSTYTVRDICKYSTSKNGCFFINRFHSL